MRLDESQKTALIELVRQAARDEIMPRFRRLNDGAIRTKSAPDDLVTDADLASEDVITKGAHHILPGALVVGEEAVVSDPALLDGISDAELSVIIDPIDGTWNFANGLATFGVILAVAHRGETIFGLLYDPVMDDWIMASKGEGALYVSADGSSKSLRTSMTRPLDASSGLIPLFLFSRDRIDHLASQYSSFGRISSLNCSCHEYRLLAQGKADFILNCGMNPWDHAAGVLITQEAMGVASLFDGSDYTPSKNKGPFLVANSAQTMSDLKQRFAWLAKR